MDALWNLLENAAILVAGLAVRFAFAAAVLAVLVALLLPFLYAGEGVRRLWRRAAGFASVGGLTWRRGIYYTPTHAWLRSRAGRLRVGLDDLAGRLLRSIDSIALPPVGAVLQAGDAFLTLGSGGRGVAIPAPVAGTVTRVNRSLLERPQAVIDDPYGRGWLIEVEPDDQRFRSLAHDRPARDWMSQEAARLSYALEKATGILAADGGELVVPTHLLIGDPERMALEQQFLQAVPAPPPPN